VRPLYSFSALDSFLHRLDPRTKLIFALTYLAFSFLLPAPWVLFVAMILIIWVFAGISPKEYYHFLVLMLPIMLGITAVHTILIGGPPYVLQVDLRIWRMGFSAQGLQSGLELAFRLGTMGLAFTVFAMTTDPFHWGMAMYKWGLPYKVAFLFAFAVRLYPLIQEEFLVIQRALRARGSNVLSTPNPLAFFPGVVMAAVPLGLGAIRRSQEMALAMELRGLHIPEHTGRPRVLFREPVLRPLDVAIIALCVVSLVSVIAWRMINR